MKAIKKISQIVHDLLVSPYYVYPVYKKCKHLESLLLRTVSDDLRLAYRNHALSSTEPLTEPSDRKQKIIVSLTTYGIRAEQVYLTLESLFFQTMRADKIILWLDEQEFTPTTMPNILKRLEKRGVEICFCKNIRSYKKLIPTLGKYPDDLVITIDDDILYPEYFIEKLYMAHINEPRMIHCFNASRIIVNSATSLEQYVKWPDAASNTPSLLTFPIGCGGILYFPGCFDADVANEECFTTLAPTGDDIWFKAMSLKKETLCNVVPSLNSFERDFTVLANLQADSLWSVNVNRNDEQVNAVFNHYNLWQYLRNEQ